MIPLSRTIPDPLHSDDEERFVLIGLSHSQELLVAVHLEHVDHIRLVSARKANRREKKQYEEG